MPLTIKMANQVLISGSNAKGMIEHAEQTAVKQEIMPILRIYHHLYTFDDKMECQFYATSLI
jgi:hypothetical protein